MKNLRALLFFPLLSFIFLFFFYATRSPNMMDGALRGGQRLPTLPDVHC